MRHKVSVDRHKPYVGVGSLKLKFSIEDVFFSKEKIKKKKGKKRFEGMHGFRHERQSDKCRSADSTYVGYVQSPRAGPAFFQILNCRRWQQQF